MTDRKRCAYCDKPIATQEEWDEIPEYEGDHLCWGGECTVESSEEILYRLRAENEKLTKYTKTLEKAFDEDTWKKIKAAMEEE